MKLKWTEKKFCIIFLSLFFGFFLCVCVFNYSLDAYGVWRSSYESQVLEPNKNYVKTKHVIEHPGLYDSFFFGSSKVGHIETNLLTDGHYYNMCYSEGIPADWLVTIQTLIEHDVLIKNIALGIDEFSFTLDPKEHQKNLLRIYYKDLTLEEKCKFYLLRNPFDLYNRTTIQAILQKQPPFLASDDLLGTGVAKGNDEILELNMAEHLLSERLKIPTDFYLLDRTDATLEEIKQIMTLCKENDIALTIFFNPIHKLTYELHKESTEMAKDRLGKITGYWDFSGLNSITTDDYYWYETSHYRHNVGKMILERIYGIDTGETLPTDFGVYREITP
ncbi:MAG: hypothetical protein RRX92_03055 [Lachnospiraceae bacterium]